MSHSATVSRLKRDLIEILGLIRLGRKVRKDLEALGTVEVTALVLYLVEDLSITMLVKGELHLDSHRRFGIPELSVSRALEERTLFGLR